MEYVIVYIDKANRKYFRVLDKDPIYPWTSFINDAIRYSLNEALQAISQFSGALDQDEMLGIKRVL